MKALSFVLAVLLSSPVLAASDWIEVSDSTSSATYVDRLSVSSSMGPVEVSVLRSYVDVVTLGQDAVSGESLYPHRSVKTAYTVDCTTGQVATAGWQLFEGNLGDGKLVWESRVADGRPARPTLAEERMTLGMTCAIQAALLNTEVMQAAR